MSYTVCLHGGLVTELTPIFELTLFRTVSLFATFFGAPQDIAAFEHRDT